MIKIFNQSLLSILSLLMCVAVLTSCEKDDDERSSSQVELLSFGPTGAKHGDTLRFIGNRLDAVTAIQLTGALVPQASFIKQTADGIWIIVPKETARGPVMLKTAGGDIVSKTSLDLSVTTKVTAVTPQARPGSNITITGDFLNWATRVTFNNNKVVDSTAFISKSMTQLVVRVPMDAQTGRLVVSYGGVAPAPLEVTTDTVRINVPLVTGLAPNPVKHKTNLTITGTDMDLVSQILFPGGDTVVSTAFVSQSANQVVVSVPSKTQKGKITLVAPSGIKTVSSMDVDVVLPAITGMSPSPANIGGNITITGTNLDLVKGISFVGVTAEVTSFVSQSPSQIVVRVPTGSLPGKLTFFVLNSTLSVKSANDLGIVGASVAPIIIYDDAITSAWNGWIGGGWGGAKDVNNTTNVKSGSKSIKIDYTSGGYGVPLQLGGANIPLGGYTSLKMSVYGGAGSNNKSVNVGFNEVDGRTITIVEGQWTDFTIPLSQISTAGTLTHLYLKNYSATGDFTIYVDNLGIH